VLFPIVELNNLYASPAIISMRMRTGHLARMGEMRNVFKILVGKLEGKKPLERTRRTWVDNIRMDIREIRVGDCGLD